MRRAIRDPNRLAYWTLPTSGPHLPLSRAELGPRLFVASSVTLARDRIAERTGRRGKTGFITRMHEGLLGGPVRVGRDPRETLADLSSLLSGFALPLNDLSKIGHDPPR